MMLYDRKSGSVIPELESGKKGLEFLYNTTLGRMILKIATMPFISNLSRAYYGSVLSKHSIKGFVKKNSIDITDEEISEFKTFNEFFTRRRQVPFCNEESVLCAVADSKLSYYDISPELRINVKKSNYSVAEILDDEKMAQRFSGGCCMVFRLAVDDMHHYFFFDKGNVISQKKIKGELHTVRPISEKYNVFTRNKREVTVMETKNFGLAAYVEVGALMVGRIVNAPIGEFERGTEKGYFEFGGSTVIVLLEKKPQFDSDIQKANAEGIETKVVAGERIGQI